MIPARIARLNTDGSTDTSFQIGYGANLEARAVAILADNSFLIGGDFTTVDLENQARLSLRNPDGTKNVGFNLQADDSVRAIVATTDGKAIVGGQFTAIGVTPRTGLARILSNGLLEAAFAPQPNGIIHAIASQEDGKLLAGGAFSSIGGISRTNLARLYSDPQVNNLTVVGASTVNWDRAGSSPETERTTFELSTDGGSSWSPLGAGVATSGGWQITGLTLSGTGQIRARAYPFSASSQGIVEDITAFSFTPEIQVEQPVGTILVDAGSTVAYGSIQLGQELNLEFTIRNIGLDDLDLTTPNQVALSGTNANQWSIVSQPATPVVPGGSVTFTVTFDPTTAGSKSAILTILSNDSDEGTFTVSLTGEATPGPGARDDSFQPVANNTIFAPPFDVDGKIFVAGAFTSLNGVGRNRTGRLLANGTSDTGFGGTGANNIVLCAATQIDGKIVIGGTFTSVNGVARNRIARLNVDGTLDTTFNPNANAQVNALDIYPNGDILVSGFFTSIAGNTRYGVARLLGTGAINGSFAPAVTSTFQTRFATLDAQDRVLLSGNYLVRLTSTGALDTSFGTSGAVATGGYIDSIAVDRDGKILLGGGFSDIEGEAKVRFGRLNSDGSVDTGFTCDANGRVYALMVQTDGNIILGGAFTTLGGGSHVGLARSVPTGGEDTTFAPTLAAAIGVSNVENQPDGKVLVAGAFVFSGGANAQLARLYNDSAATELSVVSATEVQWLRSGAGPEARSVTFQYSQNSGATWTILGQGTRITGGWRLTGISLPVSGTLRALARVTGANNNGYSAIVAEQTPFADLAVPDIQIEQPTNSLVADGGSRQFTGVLVGQNSSLIFTIRNTGGATLTSLAATTTNGAEFSVVALGATSLAVGASTSCEVRFTPSTTGARQATLLITSNVSGSKNPYSVLLNGNGITTPLVTTLAAQSVTGTTAVIRGSFTARADTASGYFQYRAGTSGPWIQIPLTPTAIVNQFNPQVINQGLTGLTPATLYQFRAVIYNTVTGSGSPVFGSTLSFTTS